MSLCQRAGRSHLRATRHHHRSSARTLHHDRTSNRTRTRARSRGRSIPHRRARNRIASKAPIEIKHDARIGIAIRAGDGHSAWQRRGPGPRDADLHALHVELRATGRVDVVRRVGLVQGDDLAAEEVVAGREGGGQREAANPFVGDERVDRPELSASVVASFGKFHPDGAGARGARGRDVDHYGAFVGLWVC